MGRLLPLLFLVQIVLAVIALISCISAEDGDLRGLPKIAWVFIILLFPLIGSIVYFLAGRPVSTAPRRGVWPTGSGFPEAERPRRPLAPDDDPDFLRSLRDRRDESPRKPQESPPQPQESPPQPPEDKPKDDLPEG